MISTDCACHPPFEQLGSWKLVQNIMHAEKESSILQWYSSTGEYLLIGWYTLNGVDAGTPFCSFKYLSSNSTWISAARFEWVHRRILCDLSNCTKRRTAWLRVNVFPVPNGPKTTRGAASHSRDAIRLITSFWWSFNRWSRSHCQRIVAYNFKIKSSGDLIKNLQLMEQGNFNVTGGSNSWLFI